MNDIGGRVSQVNSQMCTLSSLGILQRWANNIRLWILQKKISISSGAFITVVTLMTTMQSITLYAFRHSPMDVRCPETRQHLFNSFKLIQIQMFVNCHEKFEILKYAV